MEINIKHRSKKKLVELERITKLLKSTKVVCLFSLNQILHIKEYIELDFVGFSYSFSFFEFPLKISWPYKQSLRDIHEREMILEGLVTV